MFRMQQIKLINLTSARSNPGEKPIFSLMEVAEGFLTIPVTMQSFSNIGADKF